MKKKKIFISVSGILVMTTIVGCMQLNKWFGYFKEGNASKYNIEKVETITESSLSGKKIIFLGSSVTLGMAAKNTSFVDYIEKKDSVKAIKEAVSGTTLVDNGRDSYVQRMLNKLDKNINIDGFVCQLSTNDISKNLPLGEISESKNLQDFDTTTITGAIEYIICYSQQTWNCPIVFYTSTKYESEAYDKMVFRLLELQKKWNIKVINMWDDEEMNNIDDAHRKLYMNDDVHPTKAGYLEWWTPQIEKYLYEYLK